MMVLDLGPEGDRTWIRDAACHDTDNRVFFPTDQEPMLAEVAKRICDRCPVRADCLDYALANNEQGIWGGTSERQRMRMRRSLRALGTPAPRSPNTIVNQKAAP